MYISLSLLGNGYVNILTRQRRIFTGIIFYAVRVISKESRRLVLPRTSCNITLSCTIMVERALQSGDPTIELQPEGCCSKSHFPLFSSLPSGIFRVTTLPTDHLLLLATTPCSVRHSHNYIIRKASSTKKDQKISLHVCFLNLPSCLFSLGVSTRIF
jgi:hypothetical protein